LADVPDVQPEGRGLVSTLEIWPEALTETEDTVMAAATLARPGRDGRFQLWYRFPKSFRATLSRSCDPFVQAALFTAMRTSSRMVVHGESSPSLLRNLEEFQMAWTAWKPELYHKVDLFAEGEREAAPAESPATVMAFSGGADSAFTAWRHRSGGLGREQCDVQAGLMVHGLDIPLEDTAGYNGAAARSAGMLSSLGVPLFRMATNFRDLEDDWVDAHGAGLASCLTLLRGQYRTGLIASSYPYAALSLPYGSNPLTDVMMSSCGFRILHDGARYNRLEKLRALARWPEAMRYMRVCWEGVQRDRNCCRCQKCVSNMLYLRILGQRLPECFPRDIQDRDIVRLRYHDSAMIQSMERLVQTAKREKVSGSWVRALRVSILLNRVRLGMGRHRPA
jgi:hypothetical protein